jgi:hypothetical protein
MLEDALKDIIEIQKEISNKKNELKNLQVRFKKLQDQILPTAMERKIVFEGVRIRVLGLLGRKRFNKERLKNILIDRLGDRNAEVIILEATEFGDPNPYIKVVLPKDYYS